MQSILQHKETKHTFSPPAFFELLKAGHPAFVSLLSSRLLLDWHVLLAHLVNHVQHDLQMLYKCSSLRLTYWMHICARDTKLDMHMHVLKASTRSCKRSTKTATLSASSNAEKGAVAKGQSHLIVLLDQTLQVTVDWQCPAWHSV